MPARSIPVANGLRMLFDKALAEGGQLVDGYVHLPSSVGNGFIKLVSIEPGLLLTIHRYYLQEETVVERLAEQNQAERLLVSFQSFDPALSAAGHLSTAQLASTSIAFRTVLPAHTLIFFVGLVVEKAVLAYWLGNPQAGPLGLFTDQQPRLVEALLTPEIQAALQDIATLRPANELNVLFYRIKVQELLYWLFQELAQRSIDGSRALHSTDVARIFQVRAALLSSLDNPPSLAQLAQSAGMGQTKLKQLFHQVFGSSPYAYYQVARLQQAKRLLAQWSVSEVGHQLGYTNLGHFAQLFKRQYGLTPKRYKAALVIRDTH
ncbi:MAG: helix-turn-helix transcriptional regulator [Williamsia sp.]|nr:helix-turn-helix transcriptional regulator [Williamsia sp.]